MKTSKIKSLQQKAIKEAQKEINKIFTKYSLLINAEISNQLPNKTILVNGNGMSILFDNKNNEIKKGVYWKQNNVGDKQLFYLSSLQYAESLRGIFNIKSEIKSCK